MPTSTTKVIVVDQVLPSLYWPGNAIVIILECGHRHIRPKDWRVDGHPVGPGDPFDCCFCEDGDAADRDR